MSSLKQDLRAILGSDIVLKSALDRGIVNLRAAARWMREVHGLEASEEAILSALRRLIGEPPGRMVRLDDAKALLQGAQVDLRTNLASLVATKSPRLSRKVQRFLDRVEGQVGEPVRFVLYGDQFTAYASGQHLPELESIIGPDEVLERSFGLSELVLVGSPAPDRVPGVLSLVATSLALAGIPIVAIHGGSDRLSIYVAGSDAVLAYEVLHALTTP